ncbi:hypothetical protein E2562_011514 [Oryza meyeriana var. granulata]|uniref:Uncharacterized protein n=1 Tax=Oryza meyeriana var. granulata TaxID=110450 RepID=A0A6G1D325_9ORYZ|nr:hypothetical protein E2562_011514 [Oryza meyeriana var. granulata]
MGVPAAGALGLAADVGVARGSTEPSTVSASKCPDPSSSVRYSTTKSTPVPMSSSLSFQVQDVRSSKTASLDTTARRDAGL